MIPQVLEVFGKLTVPVGNVGSVQDVIVADILDRLGQELFLSLERISKSDASDFAACDKQIV